jgi:outer membrane immunogenic protein
VRFCFRFIGLVCLLILGAGSPARAQIGGAPTVDWSGPYLGLHGGYGWSNVDAGIGTDARVDGWLGGGHVGIQGQFDRWVVGIEASYSGGELDGSKTVIFDGAPLKLDASISDLFLVTGRLGYAWADRLAYIKAGYASADVEFSTTYLRDLATNNARLNGWTAGFGIERAITSNLVIGLEYNYVDLGSKSLAVAPPVAVAALFLPPPKPTKIEVDGLHTVFARVSFKFGGPPPAPPESYK